MVAARRPHAEAHGLTPSEVQVTELWDAGLSVSDIAVALNIRRTTVGQIVKYCDDRPDNWRQQCQVANALFLQRLYSVHPDRLRASVELNDAGAGAGLI